MPVTTNLSELSPGIWELSLTPVDIEVGETITISWTSGSVITAAFTALTDSEADMRTGLGNAVSAAILAAGPDGQWETVTANLGSGATLVLEFGDSLGGYLQAESDNEEEEVATKLWIGDSQPVAQITSVTPANVEIGDIFTLTCNGKSVSVTATAATALNVSTLLKAAIEAAAVTVPEWAEMTPTLDGSVLLLTAATAGVPFTVTADDTHGSSLGVTVTTTRAAVAGSNMTQTFRIPNTAVGTFTVTIGDQTTSGIAIGASAATVETAVEGLSTVGSGNGTISKSTDANDDIYEIEFTGSLAATAVATAIVEITSTKPLIRTTQIGATTGTPQNEIQTVDFGTVANTCTLTLDGQTTAPIGSASSAADLETALEALSNVVAVTVSKSGTVFTIEFTDIDGMANQSQLTASVYQSSGSSTHRITVDVVDEVAAVNEQQTVTLTGTPTGGTFTLTFDGQTTGTIVYNASSGTLDTALEALSNIGASDLTVSGSAGGPWVVTFGGSLAATDVALMTGNAGSLTGGTAQTLTVDEETASSGPNHWDDAANWSPSGVPATADHVRFEVGSSECLYGLDQNAVTLASLHIAMTWTGKLGLPRINESGYHEYRTRELTCGITSLIVGTGSGSGPTKVALNTEAIATTITVRDSGGSSETGVPCVIWRGAHADNVITVQGGEFGSAWWSDETAQISQLTQLGGSVFLKNTTIDDALDVTNQDFRAYNCTLGTKSLNA